MVTHPLGRLVDPLHRDDLHVGDDGMQRAAVHHLLRGCDAAGGRARDAAVLGGDRGCRPSPGPAAHGRRAVQGTVATSIDYCTPPDGKPSQGSCLSKHDEDLRCWDEICPQGARWIGMWRVGCLYCLYGALSSEMRHPPRGAGCEPLAVCTRAWPSDRTTIAARPMMSGRLSRYDALLLRLAPNLEAMAAERRPFIQEAHPVVRE
jgi:hypothetical protein